MVLYPWEGCLEETLMPPKVRKLKPDLGKAGFVWEPGKGSHTHWYYRDDYSIWVQLSGNDGADAKEYQVRQVRDAIRRAKELKK